MRFEISSSKEIILDNVESLRLNTPLNDEQGKKKEEEEKK